MILANKPGLFVITDGLTAYFDLPVSKNIILHSIGAQFF